MRINSHLPAVAPVGYARPSRLPPRSVSDSARNSDQAECASAPFQPESLQPLWPDPRGFAAKAPRQRRRSSGVLAAEVGDAAPASVGTVDSHRKGGADLAHPGVAQTPQPADEDCKRDAFDRVEVHCRTTRHGVVTGFEHDFADEPPKRCRAGRYECAAVSRDHCVARQHDDWSTTDFGHLALPDLPSQGDGAHDDAAARRNDARSPHSSGSSSGCSS